MTTGDQRTSVSWDILLKLLNERFPLLVRVGGDEVRDRVARAVSTESREEGGRDTRSIRIVTYRGKAFDYADIAHVTIAVNKRDGQGVPVAYTVELGPANHVLEFTA